MTALARTTAAPAAPAAAIRLPEPLERAVCFAIHTPPHQPFEVTAAERDDASATVLACEQECRPASDKVITDWLLGLRPGTAGLPTERRDVEALARVVAIACDDIPLPA